jgi:hypothetical protein
MFFDNNAVTYVTNLINNGSNYKYNTLSNINNITPEYLFKILDNGCTNISKGYFQSIVDKTFDIDSMNKTIDILIITEETLTVSTQKILGLLVVEKGECSKYSDVFTINLICSKYKLGSLLITIYLSLIKILHLNIVSETQQLGLLELASGYTNTAGFCLYSKYGFVYNPTLYSLQCFSDYRNLPMESNIIGISENEIISIYKANNPVFPKPKMCFVNVKYQELLGMLLNLLIYVLIAPNNMQKYLITPYTTSNYTLYDYHIFWNVVLEKKVELVNKIIDNIYYNNFTGLDELTKYIIAKPGQDLSPIPKITRSSNPLNKLINSIMNIKPTNGGRKQKQTKNILRKKTKKMSRNITKKVSRKRRK